MNFLIGYGSDDEDTSSDKKIEALPEPAVTVKAHNTNTNKIATINPKLENLSSNHGHTIIVSNINVKNVNNGMNNKKQKKKKLDISFLPPEILAALTRGDSLNDSDDDEDLDRNKLAKSKLENTKGKNSEILQDKLLSMLPAPKTQSSLEKQTNSDPPLTQINKISNNNNDNNNKLASSFNFSYNTTTVQKTSNNEIKSAVPIKNPITSNTFKNQPSLLNNKIYAFEEPLVEESDKNEISYTVSDQYIYNNNNNNNNPNIPAGSAPIQYNDNYYNSSNNNSNINNKKKRTRDIEQQLMSGNLDAVTNDIVKDINVDRKWDSLQYSDLQQREQMVQREFGLGNINNSFTQPTRVQNRKHQLTSLAVKAAETELALLDVRGSRMKTKSETQGKYGW